jgi:hypothetical protein
VQCSILSPAAIAEIARKKDEAYHKKCIKSVGIIHRQAAKWGVKWVANIVKRRRQLIHGHVGGRVHASIRTQGKKREERLQLLLNGYIYDEPIILE